MTSIHDLISVLAKFWNIKKAEDRHIERLAGLFKNYGLKLPENKWTGETPAFDSVKQACEAGVEGEIANMKLYTRLLKTTERDDILMVYTALQRASEENHLPAFKRCSFNSVNNII